MKHAIILAALLSACGTDHEVNGGTDNKVIVTIEHRIPLCEDQIFDTKKSKLACIEAVTSQTVDVEVLSENLSADQIDAILGASND